MFKAKLLQPEVDYKSGRVVARHEILEGNYREFYDVADKEKVFDLGIRRHREHRSLDSNSYYHVLINKIAGALGASMQEVKNLTLARYGQLEHDENGHTVNVIVPDSINVMAWSELHLAPTSQTQLLNGVLYRVYKVIKGSHEYDSKEMCELIRGTISEAKAVGLTDAEIMSPREREMMQNMYGIKVGA